MIWPRHTIFAFSMLLSAGMASVKVELLCYCNIPACLASGHTCLSPARICLSEKRDRSWHHACIEFFSQRASLDYCSAKDKRHCCSEELCNKPEQESSPTFVPLKQNHYTGNSSKFDMPVPRKTNFSPLVRITVIAVPVAIGSLLLVLIAFTDRMLWSGAADRHQTNQTISKAMLAKSSLKSLSCVVLDKDQHGWTVVRSCTSMGTIDPAIGQSLSHAFSTDSESSDSSKENYFVFDV